MADENRTEETDEDRARDERVRATIETARRALARFAKHRQAQDASESTLLLALESHDVERIASAWNETRLHYAGSTALVQFFAGALDQLAALAGANTPEQHTREQRANMRTRYQLQLRLEDATPDGVRSQLEEHRIYCNDPDCLIESIIQEHIDAVAQ